MTSLRSTIIILNDRFLPNGEGGAYLYGVVQHALRAADLLAATGEVNVGFVLYLRDQTITKPDLQERTVLGHYPAVTLRFNFDMDRPAVKESFRLATEMIACAWRVHSDGDTQPLLYYQSSAVLPLGPPELDTVITHHTPFVADVVEELGVDAARRAFDWDHPKADHLAALQAEALSITATRANIHCAEISMIQERFLCRSGVPVERIGRLPQPLDGCRSTERLPVELESFLNEAADGLIAFTAVARLDHFKNIDLFVEACCAGLRDGYLGGAVLVGGFDHDDERARLRAVVPAGVENLFLFVPRVSRAALVGDMFPRLAGAGVFVCSSRFDLVPYTALESARAGVCTVVPDTGSVGAAEYIPEEYRFAPSSGALEGLLRRLALSSEALGRFSPTADSIRISTSGESFLGAFEQLCGKVGGVPPRLAPLPAGGQQS